MTLKPEDLEKIERYCNGYANDIEKDDVESLLANGENKFSVRELLEKDWNSIMADDTGPVVDLTYLLDRIHHRIRRIESEKTQKPFNKFIRAFSKIAASLILPIILGSLVLIVYINHRYHTAINKETWVSIYAPMGSRVAFGLPDSTKGILNSGSKLSYTLPFAEKRNLKLEGEAWFEVHHDERYPFIISAGQSTVKVVGTSFNLNSYPDENFLELVLKAGRVTFIDQDNGSEINMLPSERLISRGGRIQMAKVDPDKYIAWTEGKLMFRSDSITEVARRIERWYNVNITIADTELYKYTFRATFQDDKLADVLKYLAMTSPISYKIIPRIIMPDGTLKKEEVIIMKDKRKL
jgi:transmembrane sensor